MTRTQSAVAVPATTSQFVNIADATEATPAQRRGVWAGVLLASLATWGVVAMGAGAIISAV